MAIPSDPSNNVRKEIKFVLRELFLAFDVKQTHQPNSSIDKEKRKYTLLITHLLYIRPTYLL